MAAREGLDQVALKYASSSGGDAVDADPDPSPQLPDQSADLVLGATTGGIMRNKGRPGRKVTPGADSVVWSDSSLAVDKEQSAGLPGSVTPNRTPAESDSDLPRTLSRKATNMAWTTPSNFQPGRPTSLSVSCGCGCLCGV